jgi:hypothetical protein
MYGNKGIVGYMCIVKGLRSGDPWATPWWGFATLVLHPMPATTRRR